MLFNSSQFLIFFPIVVLVYFIIPIKFRNLWLLLASYFFYMCWSPRYALLLLLVTCITYVAGLLLAYVNHKYDGRILYKRLIVAGSISVNLLILVWFKYFYFILEQINFFLKKLNIEIIEPAFSIVLPVGISFYIFQSISYVIDVYRKDTPVEKSFLRYALYISFFPQLVAGPIEKSKDFLKQFYERHQFDYHRMKSGLLLMAWGFFQKVVIADRVAIIVDKIYGGHEIYGGFYLIVATILFAVQLYCDFSGYSTIAIGAAEVLGFKLSDNFKCPYFSKSIAEFWRRWHVSLGSWFREYVYFPLGGNRKGRIRKYLNLMIVFLTSGLWHGANWTYIIWGGLNGLYQIVGDILMPLRNKCCTVMQLKRDSFSHSLYKVIITNSLFGFSLIFFRAENITAAISILKSIFTTFNPGVLFDGSLYTLGVSNKGFVLMMLSLLILVVGDLCKYFGFSIREFVFKQELWFRWTFYIVSIMTILIFGVYGSQSSNFIYFIF